MAGIDLHLVLQDVSITLSGQIEISVIGEIHDRLLVRSRRILDLQIFSCERITHHGGQRSRKSLIAIGTDVGQLNSVRDLFCFPDRFVESLCASMQRVITVILRNLIALPVQGKLPARDPVSIAPNQRAKERGIGFGAAGIPVERDAVVHEDAPNLPARHLVTLPVEQLDHGSVRRAAHRAGRGAQIRR